MTDLQITLSIEASSAQELSVLTVRTQLVWGMQLNFFDFTQTKKGTFICWYKVPHSIWMEKVANGKA